MGPQNELGLHNPEHVSPLIEQAPLTGGTCRGEVVRSI